MNVEGMKMPFYSFVSKQLKHRASTTSGQRSNEALSAATTVQIDLECSQSEHMYVICQRLILKMSLILLRLGLAYILFFKQDITVSNKAFLHQF